MWFIILGGNEEEQRDDDEEFVELFHFFAGVIFRGERYHRLHIVSHILALFGKFCKLGYQGSIAIFHSIFFTYIFT